MRDQRSGPSTEPADRVERTDDGVERTDDRTRGLDTHSTIPADRGPSAHDPIPTITATDPALAAIVDYERRRQETTLSLIASENCASPAVRAAQGSCLTNKYAEGRPGSRYYAGCEHVDALERLAERRARALFGAEYVNVQPHSGSQANMAAYVALLEPGDTILSLALSDGGHLSHGHRHSFASSYYEAAHYHVDEATGRLDYDAIAERARGVDPDVIVAGYSAYPRAVDWERFREIADDVDAALVADIAHLTGLVAAGVHRSPVGVADVVTGSTHKTIRAGRGGIVMTDDADVADALHRAVLPGVQGGPLVHNVAGKAAGFGEALADDGEGVAPAFAAYARRIVDTADALGERLRGRGFDLVSEGTDVHFVLVDLRETHPDLPGTDAEDALERAGLVVSRSPVPGDHRPNHVGSGVRLGTPVLATRGLDAEDARRVADWIADVLDAPEDEDVIDRVRTAVRACCLEHPIEPAVAPPAAPSVEHTVDRAEEDR